MRNTLQEVKMPEKEESTKAHQSELRRDSIQPEALQLVPEALARKYNAIPLDIKGNVLYVAMANPDDIFALEALATLSQMRIEPEAANVQEILEAIDFNYRSYDEIEKQVSTLSLPDETTTEEITPDTVADAPVAKALTLIVNEAIKARASDIHLQPEEGKLRVRYRIDGTLNDTLSLPVATATQLISRIKILSDMNIADHQRPQDGQFSVKPKDRPEIDVRVGTIPTVHGEMAALRLLDKSKAMMTLEQLGFLPESLARYEEMLKVPYGMILVTGPTGAGKTTTLYASINGLDSKGRNIITIEDPVEYRFQNINQIQVNPRAGLTFASGLRSILRLDPDVILVGEIRDAETANIAIQSALTGHLVLSSIHANDAVGVISRFLDLGIEPFLIASALIGVVAQRMGRRTCPDCGKMIEAPLLERRAYAKETGEERSEFLVGEGCKSCTYTGYRRRIGFFEILRISDEIRAMVLDDAPAAQIRTQAIEEGMVPLIKDGMLKVQANITNPAEVLRNAYTTD
jgi:general secretion pathway protein E